jgi:hypothetical protein
VTTSGRLAGRQAQLVALSQFSSSSAHHINMFLSLKRYTFTALDKIPVQLLKIIISKGSKIT